MKTRIAKFIASSGVASRRDAEQLITDGWVSVNGAVITSPVFFVDGSEEITVNGKLIKQSDDIKLYAFYKPINTMTTARDPDGRQTIYDKLPDEYKNLKYVGRLDYKTTGLLLLTNNGDLARRLTLPSSKIERTYLATVSGNDVAGLVRARNGITIDGINYRPMKIDVQKDKTLLVTITEGKKNEVRIVLRACGLPVIKLHRISFGNIALGNLPLGQIQKIDQKRIDVLIKSL